MSVALGFMLYAFIRPSESFKTIDDWHGHFFILFVLEVGFCLWVCLPKLVCALECFCAFVCTVARSYVYTYICTCNDMHLCRHTHISTVCWWERVKEVCLKGNTRWRRGGKKNCSNPNDFFSFLFIFRFFLIFKYLLDVNLKYLFHSVFSWRWWLKL